MLDSHSDSQFNKKTSTTSADEHVQEIITNLKKKFNYNNVLNNGKLQITQADIHIPEIRSEVQDFILYYLEKEDDYGQSYALDLVKQQQVTREALNTPEIQKAIEVAVYRKLDNTKKMISMEQFAFAAELVRGFGVIPTADMQKRVKEILIRIFSLGTGMSKEKWFTFVALIESFQMPKEMLVSPEMKQYVDKLLATCLEENDLHYYKKFRALFYVSDGEDTNQSLSLEKIKELMIDFYSKGKIEEADALIQANTLPKDTLKHLVLDGVLRGFTNGRNTWDHSVVTLRKVQDMFNISEKEVKKVIIEAIINKVVVFPAMGSERNHELEAQYLIRDEELQEAAEKKLIAVLQEGEIDAAYLLKKLFHIPKEYILSEEVQAATKDAIVKIEDIYDDWEDMKQKMIGKLERNFVEGKLQEPPTTTRHLSI